MQRPTALMFRYRDSKMRLARTCEIKNGIQILSQGKAERKSYGGKISFPYFHLEKFSFASMLREFQFFGDPKSHLRNLMMKNQVSKVYIFGTYFIVQAFGLKNRIARHFIISEKSARNR